MLLKTERKKSHSVSDDSGDDENKDAKLSGSAITAIKSDDWEMLQQMKKLFDRIHEACQQQLDPTWVQWIGRKAGAFNPTVSDAELIGAVRQIGIASTKFKDAFEVLFIS